MALKITRIRVERAFRMETLEKIGVAVKGASAGEKLSLELVQLNPPGYRDYVINRAYRVGETTVTADGTAWFSLDARYLNLTVDGRLGVRITRTVAGRSKVVAVRPTLFSPIGNWFWKLFHPGWKARGYFDPELVVAN